MLVHKLFDLVGGLDAVALWHAVVHQDQFVSVALAPVALFYPVDGLIAVSRCVTLNIEVH